MKVFHWKSRLIGVRLLPAPIVRYPIIIDENEIHLVRIGRSFRAVFPVTAIRNAAVTPPSYAPPIFIFILPQTLEYRARPLQNRRNDVPTLLCMAQAATSD